MNFTNLFIYGKLVDPYVRQDMLGRPHPYMQRDSIKGYTVVEGDEASYPTIAPASPLDVVDGFVTVINEAEFRILDEFVVGSIRRDTVKLESGKEAWVLISG